MTHATLNKMIGMAEIYNELYWNYSIGFIAAQAGSDKRPEIHLSVNAFDELAERLQPDIKYKNNDKLRPCFFYSGVLFFCLLDEIEAAARGYLTEAEADFYGR